MRYYTLGCRKVFFSGDLYPRLEGKHNMALTLTKTLQLGLIGLSFTALAACATAPSTSAEMTTTKLAMAEVPAEGVVAEGADPNEEVCKRIKQTTTRFTKKVCYSRQQWADMAAAARRSTANAQQQGSIQKRKGG